MTARGRGILAVGLAVWLIAWLFGSPVLAPVAVGLVLVVPLAVAWVRLTSHRLSAHRRWDTRRVVEGDHVRVELRVEPASRIPLPGVVACERAGRLGEHEVELRREGHIYRGVYHLHRVPRGHHTFEPVRLSISDPWGLAASTFEVEERSVLVVQPRLIALERLFSDSGTALAGGSGAAMLRGGGFDLHGIRHHVPGESLRTVHWPSTARTGTLMVREFEDSPRDEVVVLLDGHDAGAAGSPPDSAFDVAVRAAGSILLAYVRRRRRAVLVLNTLGRETQTVAEGVEWDRALALLAAAMPDTRTPVAALLTATGGELAAARELVIVTPRLEPQLVSRLLDRAAARLPVSVVHVDAPTFAGHPPSPQREAQALRLRAAGVEVAIVRHGDDLRDALGALTGAEKDTAWNEVAGAAGA